MSLMQNLWVVYTDQPEQVGDRVGFAFTNIFYVFWYIGTTAELTRVSGRS